jgi:ABC-type Fe3+ transport system permease subunit
MTESKLHIPNQIPLRKRVLYATGAAALFAHGLHGLRVNDLIVPLVGRRRRVRVIHLHGVPAFIAWVAMLMVCVALLSVVVDHYDRRNNEASYDQFFHTAILAAITTGLLALLVNLVMAIVALFW